MNVLSFFGLNYWSVAERKFKDNEYLSDNKRTMNANLKVVCSPNNRQLTNELRHRYSDDIIVGKMLCVFEYYIDSTAQHSTAYHIIF